jgi:predicted methyltransferase
MAWPRRSGAVRTTREPIEMIRLRHTILALALASAPLVQAASAPADVAAAVSAQGRTPDNVKLDEGRKPAELLRFFGLETDAQVLDMFGANKYWAELIAPAIGPNGHVTVWQPSQFLNDERRKVFEEFVARQKNVTLISSPFEAPELPASKFDFALINLDYHDVYWENPERKIVRMEPDAWLKAFYSALKPGAVVGIVDHSAVAGSDPRTSVEKLHRIDAEVVKADFKRAGFVLEAESDLYRNPADDRSLLVFDPKIRGKTDRFVLKFRKPR